MGVIPETLGQLNNLESLYLFDNQLTGPIPEALGQLNSLKTLRSRLKTPFFYLIRLSSKWIMAI